MAVHPSPLARDRRRSRLRLTGRGRVVLVLVAAALLFAAFSVGRVSSGAATPVRLRAVIVRAGVTLWSLAEQVAPNSDPRVTVARIEALNHLSGAGLIAGERILVPS